MKTLKPLKLSGNLMHCLINCGVDSEVNKVRNTLAIGKIN